MSQAPPPGPPYFIAIPQQPTGGQRFGRWLVRTLLILSIIFNLYLLFLLGLYSSSDTIAEKHVSGERTAKDKIAIVRVDGVIAEGMIQQVLKEIDQAGRDDSIKAVVLAINSPGGTITASDEIHKYITDLRQGKLLKQSGPKPVIVSMGSVAASGGYYIAAPADHIFAQPTTITASIGVYAALPDIHELIEKYGIKVNLIKRGELKAGGSLYKKLEPDEEREMSELIENAFQRFLKVVEEGRKGKLKAGLRDELTFKSETDPKQTYVRRLADGGVHLVENALKYGLIDQIGYEREAIQYAAQTVGITTYEVIEYQRPLSLWGLILGQSEKPATAVKLRNVPGLSSKLWYLAPGYELSGAFE
jgi:protease-4